MKTRSYLFAAVVCTTTLASPGWAVAQSSNSDLNGEIWVLVSIEGRKLVGDRGVPSVSFHDDGRIEGSGFCNRLGGVVRFDGAGEVHSLTRIACMGEVGRYEGLLHSALEAAAGYDMDHGGLSLLDRNGRELARFARRTRT